jgi:hypothetical protein
VIALPARAAATHAVPLHLWVLRRPAPDAPAPTQALMVEVAGVDETPKAVYPQVVETYRRFTADPSGAIEEPGFSRTVPVVELLDESTDLTPARHVRTTPTAAQPDQFAATAKALRQQLERAAAELVTLSGGESWPPAGSEPRSWRTATVADLLRGGALNLFRATGVGRGSTGDRGEPRTGEGVSPRTLTAADVAGSRSASGATGDQSAGEEIEIREGDVLLPELLQDVSRAARVADVQDAGKHLGRHLHLIRPDPERLDPWFLAGFLTDDDNVNAAATGTSIIRVDARRLRVPLLPLDEQQRYGRAFRYLQELRAAAETASRTAERTTRSLAVGLTTGALLPPNVDTTPP